MSLTLSVARSVMRLSEMAAPPSKDGWKAAMQSEFALIKDGGQALSWSVGCLTAALGWRIVSETPFVAAMTVASLASYFGFMLLFWTTDYSAADASFPMMWQQAGCVALVCLVCSLAWPSRALLIALLITLSFGGGQFLQFQLAHVIAPHEAYAGYREVSVWGGVLIGLALEIWPGALGALAGAAMGGAWRRRARFLAA